MFLYLVIGAMIVFSVAASFVCIEDAVRFRR